MIKEKSVATKCPQCGHVKFELPENAQDTDFVKCVLCGHQIMLCDLREVGIAQARKEVIAEAKKISREMIKKVFGKKIR